MQEVLPDLHDDMSLAELAVLVPGHRRMIHCTGRGRVQGECEPQVCGQELGGREVQVHGGRQVQVHGGRQVRVLGCSGRQGLGREHRKVCGR